MDARRPHPGPGRQPLALPALVVALEDWQRRRSPVERREVVAALALLSHELGLKGLHLEVSAPLLAPMRLGSGSLRRVGDDLRPAPLVARSDATPLGQLWADGAAEPSGLRRPRRRHRHRRGPIPGARAAGRGQPGRARRRGAGHRRGAEPAARPPADRGSRAGARRRRVRSARHRRRGRADRTLSDGRNQRRPPAQDRGIAARARTAGAHHPRASVHSDPGHRHR